MFGEELMKKGLLLFFFFLILGNKSMKGTNVK